MTRLEAATGSSYPGNAALGAVDDVALTEQVAASIAADLAEVGVNLDFAPVADVNTNPLNPVIGIRAFGAEAKLAARHVAAFVRGLQSVGIAACAKHFPGHGDTAEDSHLELPVVESLDADALLPFRSAIEAGVQSIMTAHIVVRSVGDTPATMSREILHDLLREELGYAGMVMTDALEMRAISATVGVEDGAVRRDRRRGGRALPRSRPLRRVGRERARRARRRSVVRAADRGSPGRGRIAGSATAAWASSGAPSERVSRDVGREAARRALLCEGEPRLSRPALVVELEPEPGMAAGRLPQGSSDWIRDSVKSAESIRLHNGSVDAALAAAKDRQLVVVVRDAHRHEWERTAVESLLTRADDAVVVETGLPVWRPSGGAAYIATFGAARVNLEAAAERL